MRIINAKWTPKVNFLAIKCICGNVFWHRADRWKVKCPECNYGWRLGPMREQWLKLSRGTSTSIRRQENGLSRS